MTTTPLSIAVPGSKSLTIRAIFAAALAEGVSTITGGLEADDTIHARGAVRAIGAEIEDADGSWTIDGVAGRPRASEAAIDVGESGLTSRMMIAVASLVDGSTRLVGSGRIAERPMAEILMAIESLGARVVAGRGIPCEIRGTGRIGGAQIRIAADRSSQFATALLLIAPFASSPMTIEVESLSGSDGYLDLTLDVLGAFGARVAPVGARYVVEPTGLTDSHFTIEPDASAAVYPLVAAAMTGRGVTIERLSGSSRQPDTAIVDALSTMGCRVQRSESSITLFGPEQMEGIDIDASGWPDGALALAVACATASGPSEITGLHSLTHKESDRLVVLVEELNRVGATAVVTSGGLKITPGPLKPTSVISHGDHRIAMSFGLLRLLVPGLVVDEPRVVAKTWPGYWDFLRSFEEG